MENHQVMQGSLCNGWRLKPDELKGVQYAVFGCGDHNWASTYQRIPRYIDEQMAQKGATRFSTRGEADASGDFEEQLEQWKQSMWSDAMKAFGLELNKNIEERTQYIKFTIC